MRRQGLQWSPRDFGGALQSLRIRKVRISEFLLHFCFQMCHFRSKPLMHMCFWLRTGPQRGPGARPHPSCLSQRKGGLPPPGEGAPGAVTTSSLCFHLLSVSPPVSEKPA